MSTHTRRVVVYRFCSQAMLLLVALHGFTLLGSVAHADPNTPRSYADFINGAYVGALNRLPTCAESQAEYDRLTNAASTGTLLQEAGRFVSTLFETQASFDVPDYATYCQTSEYESLNPAYCNNLVGSGMAGFLTDQYQAFLLREPDSGGFNFWLNNNDGRKHLITAFKLSTEFSILVGNLYQGTRPTCPRPDCDVLVDPDPMFLVSIDWIFLDSGDMRAVTAPDPCLFVADGAILQYPISAYPQTPLFLPIDQWHVYDNGGPLPYEPYEAVGSIGFLATNGDDFTGKEGTIILTVLPCPFYFCFGGGGPIYKGAATTEPVKGEYTMTRMPARAGAATSTITRPFFRDWQGRTRLEREDGVTITDPVAGVRYTINTKENTAYRVMLSNERKNAVPADPLTKLLNENPFSDGRSLGIQRMDGVEATGQEYSSEIPAGSKLGNRESVPVTYQFWGSETLKLPLRVRIQDAVNGETLIQFKLLKKGTEPDPRLFTVPEGYRVVDAKPETRRGRLF